MVGLGFFFFDPHVRFSICLSLCPFGMFLSVLKPVRRHLDGGSLLVVVSDLGFDRLEKQYSLVVGLGYLSVLMKYKSIFIVL